MRITRQFPIVVFLVAAVGFPVVGFYYEINYSPSREDFFFGVTFGGNTTAEAKLLIDRVKEYTNLFVVDNWDVAMNETVLTDICDYASEADLNIIVYFSFIFRNSSDRASDLFEEAGVVPFHIP